MASSSAWLVLILGIGFTGALDLNIQTNSSKLLTVLDTLAGVGTAFVSNFWQFAAMRFFVGFAFDNCFTMMYILGEL